MSRSRRRKLPVEPQELEIESLNHEGRGLARVDGKVAFVSGALPGERVMARYVGRRSKYDELHTLEVLEPSADRVEPPCEWFGVCGGCAMQHLDPASQRAHKQAMFLEHLQRSAGIRAEQFELLPILFDRTTGYRRKARLGSRYVHKKGSVLLGFREKYSSFITDMVDCQVLVPAVARLIAPLREMLGTLEICRAIPQIEVAAGERDGHGGDADEVALILRHMEALSENDLATLRQFAIDHDMDWYLQPGGPDTVHRLTGDSGCERLYYGLPDHQLRMAFHPSDFTQVNGSINRAMIKQALELLDLQEDHEVLDLFCGLGNFTLPMARLCAHVVGVEGSQAMVERGEENARGNDIDNAEFHAADLMASLPDAAWTRRQYDRVLLDPPRSGAQEIIPWLGELRPEKIVYISCNPATLARDTALLAEQGYHLQKGGVMDMFPHTAHVESIALFGRN